MKRSRSVPDTPPGYPFSPPAVTSPFVNGAPLQRRVGRQNREYTERPTPLRRFLWEINMYCSSPWQHDTALMIACQATPRRHHSTLICLLHRMSRNEGLRGMSSLRYPPTTLFTLQPRETLSLPSHQRVATVCRSCGDAVRVSASARICSLPSWQWQCGESGPVAVHRLPRVGVFEVWQAEGQQCRLR